MAIQAQHNICQEMFGHLLRIANTGGRDYSSILIGKSDELDGISTIRRNEKVDCFAGRGTQRPTKTLNGNHRILHNKAASCSGLTILKPTIFWIQDSGFGR
jgi:hypothetical protein